MSFGFGWTARVCALFAVAALGPMLPSLAKATDVCVPTSDFASCPAGAESREALDLARSALSPFSSDGVPDVIHVRPGVTLSPPDTGTRLEAGPDGLTVEGNGANLRSQLDLDGWLSYRLEVKNLNVIEKNAAPIVLKGVTVRAEPRESPGNSSLTGIRLGSGNLVLEDVDIGDGTDLGKGIQVVNSDPGGRTITMRNVVVRASFTALETEGTHGEIVASRFSAPNGIDARLSSALDIKNSIIEAGSAVRVTNDDDVGYGWSSELDFDGVTIVRDADPGHEPISGIATGGAAVAVSNSIISGWPMGLAYQPHPAITIHHSNVPVPEDPGPGITDNFHADPLFVDEENSDYRLAAGSPSIDAGDPDSTLTEDFLGVGRPQDGDDAGEAVVDQGAFERPQSAPGVTITAGPHEGATFARTDFTFEFTDYPAGRAAKFECALDDGPFAECSEALSLSNLSEGDHTVAIRAEDRWGHVGDPITRSFNVDLTAPDSSITGGPAQGSTVATSTVTMEFGGTAGDTAKLECRLDEASFARCESPLVLRGLSDGTHTFEVRAIDGAGNRDETPASRSFAIDTTPPNTSLVSGPGKRARKGVLKFSFRATEAGARFSCSLVRKGKRAVYSACKSPKTYRLKPRRKKVIYVFRVRAADAHGNIDPTPAKIKATIPKKKKKR